MPTTYAIPNGRTAMDALLWAGNGANATAITGLQFQPDMVWIKNRTTNGEYHNLFDAVRGATKRVFPNDPQVENTSTATLQSFNSNGITLGTNSNVNASGANYVGWSWSANGAGITNTVGSITATVSANTTSGFSVVTYTGTGAAGSVGHGLGATPKLIIYKARSASANWLVNIGAMTGTQGDYIYTNTTAGKLNSANVLNGNATTFSLVTSPENNQNGTTFVAYCWAQVPGFSQFGTYTGNGSTDGTFVYFGFRPKFVMVKRTDTTTNWWIFDTSRSTYNVMGLELYPNLDLSEAPWTGNDFLSNGIKFRTTDTAYNANGGTYVYAAFAENPFKYANAR